MLDANRRIDVACYLMRSDEMLKLRAPSATISLLAVWLCACESSERDPIDLGANPSDCCSPPLLDCGPGGADAGGGCEDLSFLSDVPVSDLDSDADIRASEVEAELARDLEPSADSDEVLAPSDALTDWSPIEVVDPDADYLGCPPDTQSVGWSEPRCSQVRLEADLHPSDGSAPTRFVSFADSLFFRASAVNASGEPTGDELWRISAGVIELVEDIAPGPTDGIGFSYAVFDGDLYFSSHCAPDGGPLLRWGLVRIGTSGRVEECVALSTRGGPEPERAPTGLTPFGDSLYLALDEDIIGNSQLWRLPASGPMQRIPLAADRHPLPPSPSALTTFEGSLYFAADGEDADGQDVGRELWRMTSDHQLELVADLFPGLDDDDRPNSARPSGFTPFEGFLYFAADGADRSGREVGRELWRVSPDATVELVADIYSEAAPSGAPGSSAPKEFYVASDALYFVARAPSYGLWSSVGLYRLTRDLSVELVAIIEEQHSVPARPHGLTEFRRALYFFGSSLEHGWELLRLHIEEGELERVADINPGRLSGVAGPGPFHLANLLLFMARPPDSSGPELWYTTGDAAPVRFPGAHIRFHGHPSNPHEFAPHNDRVYFRAYGDDELGESIGLELFSL